MPTAHLDKAKSAKDDEFYTPRDVVAGMCDNFDWAGKVVYNPCDDWRVSAFYRYFGQMASHYAPPTDMWGGGKRAHLVRDHEVTVLRGDGSYDSPELKAAWDAADVIVTNPPFSIFTEFMRFVLAKGKDCLVLGPVTGMANSPVLDALVADELRVTPDKSILFDRPDGTSKGVPACWYSSMGRPAAKPLPTEFVPAVTLPFVDRLEGLRSFGYHGGNVVFVEKMAAMPGPEYRGLMALPITMFEFEWHGALEVLGCAVAPVVGGEKKFRRLIARWR